MSSKQDEFRDYCVELLSDLRQGEIVTKKLFGGKGLSIDGKNFAIIAFDQLWLKVDDESRHAFVEAGCRIFTYTWTDGIERHLGYYTVPEEAMESAALMRPWAVLAWGAALRAVSTKRAKSPRAAKSTKPATVSTAPSIKDKSAVNLASAVKNTTPKTKK
jgi:DNA transformation protein and related proteins